MKFLANALLLLLVISPLAEAAGADAAWKLVSEKNQIKVYRKSDDESRTKTFRGVTQFSVKNPASFEALLNDYEAIPRWMHFISSGTEIGRRSYLDRDIYFTTTLPWPISDRDVFAEMRVEQTGTNILKIHARNETSRPSREGFVRIQNLRGLLELDFIPEKREVKVTYEITIDPGGNVPAWAANIVLKDTPYFTLMKLRRIIGEERYSAYSGQQLDYPW